MTKQTTQFPISNTESDTHRAQTLFATASALGPTALDEGPLQISGSSPEDAPEAPQEPSGAGGHLRLATPDNTPTADDSETAPPSPAESKERKFLIFDEDSLDPIGEDLWGSLADADITLSTGNFRTEALLRETAMHDGTLDDSTPPVVEEVPKPNLPLPTPPDLSELPAATTASPSTQETTTLAALKRGWIRSAEEETPAPESTHTEDGESVVDDMSINTDTGMFRMSRQQKQRIEYLLNEEEDDMPTGPTESSLAWDAAELARVMAARHDEEDTDVVAERLHPRPVVRPVDPVTAPEQPAAEVAGPPDTQATPPVALVQTSTTWSDKLMTAAGAAAFLTFVVLLAIKLL